MLFRSDTRRGGRDGGGDRAGVTRIEDGRRSDRCRDRTRVLRRKEEVFHRGRLRGRGLRRGIAGGFPQQVEKPRIRQTACDAGRRCRRPRPAPRRSETRRAALPQQPEPPLAPLPTPIMPCRPAVPRIPPGGWLLSPALPRPVVNPDPELWLPYF